MTPPTTSLFARAGPGDSSVEGALEDCIGPPAEARLDATQDGLGLTWFSSAAFRVNPKLQPSFLTVDTSICWTYAGGHTLWRKDS